MKMTFLHKLLISFSTVAFFTYGIIFACGGGDDWGWDFGSNFTPEAFVDKTYSPLFLSSDVFYNRDYYGFDTDHNSRFNEEIISDWDNYLDKKVDSETLKYFIIKDSSATELKGLFDFYLNKKSNVHSTKWSKKIDFTNYKVRKFIEFLYNSKKIESSTTNTNSWSYDGSNKLKVEIKWVSFFEKKYNSEKDVFIKNRYWFQTVKALFYGDNRNETITFFNKTQNEVPKNTLYYRALAYVAGVNYSNKNYALSNYQYSIVFDKCPLMRIVTAYCFHPQEEKDWNQSLEMAKTTDEKAALWAVQGYYHDETRAIANIFELKPNSEHLEYLLTRLVNIEEGKINNSFKDKTVQQNKKAIKDTISKEAVELVDRIAKSEKTNKPYLWIIAAGYLQTLNENFKQADNYFDLAEKQIPNNKLAVNQLRLLRFVNTLSKIDNINTKNETLLINDLKWLYTELPKSNEEIFRYQNASSWSKSYLSTLYRTQKNNVMAELLNRDYLFYQNENNLQAMKTFLAKDNKSEIERIAVNVYDVKLADINQYQAVKATYQNKISDAIAFMEKTDSIQEAIFPGNPFNGNIKDCHDCDHAAFQKKKYSQIQFLKMMKEMQDKLDRNEDAYNNSLLLANAFYNITYFGNARFYYEGNIINFYGYDYNNTDPSIPMITDCSLAKMYYEKAFKAAVNDEQRAKCHYLLSKCERNSYYNNRYKNDVTNTWASYDDKVNFLAWDGFKALKKDYSKTKYYQEVIKECGYFDIYINGPKKE